MYISPFIHNSTRAVHDRKVTEGRDQVVNSVECHRGLFFCGYIKIFYCSIYAFLFICRNNISRKPTERYK